MRWLQELGLGVALGVSVTWGCVPTDFTFVEENDAGSGGAGGVASASSSSSGGPSGSSASASVSASVSVSASASASSGAGGASCGDGVVTPPEQCDDGDTEDLNGCSSDCRCGDAAMGTVAFVEPNSGHCYAAFTAVTTWGEALSLCEGQEAYLATITSEEEIAFVAKRTAMLTSAYIGANDLAVEGEWVWQNGEPWLMAPCSGEASCDPMLNLWDIDEPNDTGMNEDCGVLVTTLSALNDEDCAYGFPRICERSP